MICEYGGPGELEYVVAEHSESGLGALIAVVGL
jgi:hypothetical protein